MQSFAEFLRSRGQVPERRLPFYRRWVEMYQTFESSREGKSDGQESSAEQFLGALARRYSDWQVRQAQDALRLYLYYRNRACPREDSPACSNGAPAVSNWEDLAEELIRLLRLKHRSYRTEKTYLSWVAAF